jgi:hypothetical protein
LDVLQLLDAGQAYFGFVSSYFYFAQFLYAAIDNSASSKLTV